MWCITLHGHSAVQVEGLFLFINRHDRLRVTSHARLHSVRSIAQTYRSAITLKPLTVDVNNTDYLLTLAPVGGGIFLQNCGGAEVAWWSGG